MVCTMEEDAGQLDEKANRSSGRHSLHKHLQPLLLAHAAQALIGATSLHLVF
jgi:hypothetical protein